MEEIIPHHKYFDTQREDEEVIFIARRHWIVYVPSLLIGGFILIGAAVFCFNTQNIEFLSSNEALGASSVLLASSLMFFTALFVYASWLIHYLNFQMVTNEHLVDVDQLGLFSREISELALEDIQDVSATQHGIVQSMFKYGNVTIQTAGEKSNFEFEKVGNPYVIAKKIMEIRGRYGQEDVQISGPVSENGAKN
ncbi:PH domain-containing protein [candidate division WS5 bacterium]|uniref:PH domain-containing protein n=1 Tax=candidate division WS5 bacterium TaxID=2093353 RepID=A0A419DGY8_9BACT|nr:MAG: PH domain-containing protein [candidate division WS5 bacterium]